MLKKERLDWIGNEQLESCHSSIRWMEIHILLFFSSSASEVGGANER